jgi:hypothetical protein
LTSVFVVCNTEIYGNLEGSTGCSVNVHIPCRMTNDAGKRPSPLVCDA